ncbi:DUF924 family protein [Aquabacterium humicola]|uniref:DUF924 family protein n=1 Tax=Aquabacterium humicola TaxID=3237377 RepID=UPI002543526A|nr:DUF924 family protein [Rubrivivax pictus]
MPPDTARAVLHFWFAPPGDPEHLQTRAVWFRKDEAFDAQIRERFGTTIDAAIAGGLDAWAATPEGALAQVIVLDQFTRNAFRGTARAFAGDVRALAVARAMVASGADRGLAGVQRQFVYLPFEHAEDIDCQREALRLFAQLEADEPALAGLSRWAQAHHDIVERFGRFPHRNAALGRASTAEEVAFLQQPGSSF